jgi:hypothetical protein
MNVRWLVMVVVLGATTTLASPVRGTAESLAQVVLQMPDTLRTRMLASLAQGDLAGAVSMWELEMGRSAPRWLQAFQSAFSSDNRKAGPCIEVARSIATGFRHLGGKPSFIKFTSRGSDYLAFEVRAGEPLSTVQLSNQSIHVVVQLRNRIYDAFTGPQGLTMDEYLKRLMTEEGARITSTVLSSLEGL